MMINAVFCRFGVTSQAQQVNLVKSVKNKGDENGTLKLYHICAI